MTRNRKSPKNRTEEDRSPFGAMLHEKFLDKDNIHQTQIAEAIEKINEEAEEKQLLGRLRKVDAGTISRMIQGNWAMVAHGQRLVEQLYSIFFVLKVIWHIYQPYDTVRELLQEIPTDKLTTQARKALINLLIENEIVEPVYYTKTEEKAENPLIGRHKNIQEICEHLRDERQRLHVLVGLSGVGKTELVLQVQELATLQGYFVYELLPLTDEVDSNTAIYLIRDQLQRNPTSERSLFILDNCEQINDIAEARGKLYALLNEQPQLTILATSTIIFDEDSKIEVNGLAVPESSYEQLETIRTKDAVQLFLERAKVTDTTFDLTEDNAQTVAALCIGLDGLPLSLIIAASRIKQLGIDGVYDSLLREDITDKFPSSVVRHKSLDETIKWNYHKLQPNEQRLFRRLAIFAGSCSMEAIAEVCNLGDLPTDTLLDMLTTLENYLFITFENQRVRIRHNSLHNFAKRQLEKSEDKEQLTIQFTDYYTSLVTKYMAAKYKIEEQGVEIDIDEYMRTGKHMDRNAFGIAGLISELALGDHLVSPDDLEENPNLKFGIVVFYDKALGEVELAVKNFDDDTFFEVMGKIHDAQMKYWDSHKFIEEEYSNLNAAYAALKERRKQYVIKAIPRLYEEIKEAFEKHTIEGWTEEDYKSYNEWVDVEDYVYGDARYAAFGEADQIATISSATLFLWKDLYLFEMPYVPSLDAWENRKDRVYSPYYEDDQSWSDY